MIMRIATAAALGLLLAGSAVAQTNVPPAPAAEAAPATTTTEPAAPTRDAAPAPETATTAATAAETPATLDECIASAATLGKMAESKTLSDTNIEKLDELFTKMETHCDAKQFTEAAAVGSDIKTVIDGQ